MSDISDEEHPENSWLEDDIHTALELNGKLWKSVGDISVRNMIMWFIKRIFISVLCFCCQTLGLVLRLRVDFVLPLSQEEEEEQQEEQEPTTKIYQMGAY